MTSLNAASFYPVDLANLKSLNTGLKATKLSDEQIKRMKEVEELRYKRPVNLENHPSQKTYAEVMVNGKSVAKVYNSGAMSTSNATYGSIAKLDSVAEPGSMTGPELAQLRAEEIAKALGGTVVKSSDAITQSQWLATPPIQFEIDYAAMERDQKARQEAIEARNGSAKTKVDTQMIAQTETNAGAESIVDAAPKSENDAVAEFLKFAEMTPAEKMRYMILQQMGLSEEDLENMTPDEQAAIEQKIKEQIEAQLKKEQEEKQAATGTPENALLTA